MTPAEIEELVERIGDEFLARFRGLRPSLGEPGATSPEQDWPDQPWPRPEQGYAKSLDAALTAPELTAVELERRLGEAAAAGLRAVWTSPAWATAAARLLRGSGTRLGIVVSSPGGESSAAAKRLEAELALTAGAVDLETGLNVAALLSGEVERAAADLAGVCELAKGAGAEVAVALAIPPLALADLAGAAALARLAGARCIRPTSGGPSAIRALRGAADSGLEVSATLPRPTVGAAGALAAAGAGRLRVEDAMGLLRQAEAAQRGR